jgi:putative hemolysin
VAIALVTDQHIRKLNRTYRGKDYATDVLSFPVFRLKPEATRRGSLTRGFRLQADAREPPFLGDIVIATGVARRQARAANHSYAAELRVLALHGLLHLLGYDHDPVLLLLLAAAAVYVGTIETAFSTMMRLSLRLMAERGGRDDRLGFYLDDPIRLFLPARLILGLIFSLATMSIAILTGRTGSLRSIGMLMLFVAVFILICEHVLPMLIVRKDPERVLEVLLPPFDVAARFVQPLTNALVRLIKEARNRERQGTAPGNGEVEEPREVSNAGPNGTEEQRLDERDERKLLRSIVDFGDTLVREVMTPRPDIVAIREDATLDQLRALFREQEYSRIPVYKDNLDNIQGIVFVKDLIRIPEDESPAGMHGLLRPGTFVPETKRVSELLKEFQRKQVQLAIVVDEYGGTAGLATLEDLLEELVGEIRDEYDVETEPVVDEGDGAFLFNAKVSFDEVRERLHVEVEPEGFETVGGYVLTRVGRVPVAGESFEIDGLIVEVLEAERRRIHRVRMRRADAVPTTVEGG